MTDDRPWHERTDNPRKRMARKVLTWIGVVLGVFILVLCVGIAVLWAIETPGWALALAVLFVAITFTMWVTDDLD